MAAGGQREKGRLASAVPSGGNPKEGDSPEQSAGNTYTPAIVVPNHPLRPRLGAGFMAGAVTCRGRCLTLDDTGPGSWQITRTNCSVHGIWGCARDQALAQMSSSCKAKGKAATRLFFGWRDCS